MTTEQQTEPGEDLRGMVDMALVEHIGGQIPGIKWRPEPALDAIMALFSSRLEAAEMELDRAALALNQARQAHGKTLVLLSAEEARAHALYGYIDKAREVLERIASCARSSEPPENAFDAEPPSWAQDPFNDDCADRCGYCGSWMAVVRPGKTQCENCSDGRDIGAIARDFLASLPMDGGKE